MTVRISPRGFRVRRRRTRWGEIRFAVEGECFACRDLAGRYCDHWVLLPWRWPTRAAAERQVERWQAAHRVLLSMDQRASEEETAA